MKKFFYEHLYTEIYKVHNQIDNASSTLCALKMRLNEMAEILENEYKNKYKTGFEKGVYGAVIPYTNCKTGDKD